MRATMAKLSTPSIARGAVSIFTSSNPVSATRLAMSSGSYHVNAVDSLSSASRAAPRRCT
jgi:hypothetical protein